MSFISPNRAVADCAGETVVPLMKDRVFAAGVVCLMALSGCDKSDSGGKSVGADSDLNFTEKIHNWPLFRGDAQMQGRSQEDLVGPLEMAWSYEPSVATAEAIAAAKATKTQTKLPKKRWPIEATPVIADGTVFVGSQDGRFFAINLDKGTEKWTFTAEGPISGPGAVFGDHVFFGDTYGFIYALDATTGDEKWRYETNGQIKGGVNAMPVDGKLTIFVGSEDNSLYAFDATTGEKLWSHETDNLIVSTPSIVASKQAIIFGGCDGLLHVIPATRDGKGEKTEIEIGSYIANTSPVADGIAYIANNSGDIFAIDMESGETAWEVKTGNEFISSPAVNDTHLFVGGPDKRLVAYDRVTGEEAWEFRARRSIDSSPVVCKRAIWFGGMDARIYSINPEDGSELWSYELGTQVKASLAISAQTLVVCGDDGVVYAFRPEGL